MYFKKAILTDGFFILYFYIQTVAHGFISQ